MKLNLQLFLIFIITISCKTLPKQENKWEDILWAADVNHTGQYIAAGGNHDTVKLFSAENFKRIQNYPVGKSVTNVKWHPYQDLLAVTTQVSDDKSRLIDYATGDFVLLDSISSDGARGLAWAPDGEHFSIGDNEGNILLYNKTAGFIHKFMTGQKSITALSWHPALPKIVAVGSAVTILDLNNGKISNFTTRDFEVLLLSVAWHPSGEFLAIGDYGDFEKGYPQLVQFFKEDGTLIKSLKPGKAEFRNLAWTEDGKYLITASDALRLWDRKGKLLYQTQAGPVIWGLDIKGNTIISADASGKVCQWQLQGEKIKSVNCR